MRRQLRPDPARVLRIAPTARIWTAEAQRQEEQERRIDDLVKRWLNKSHGPNRPQK